MIRKVPIVLLVFNRPQLTQRVLDFVKIVKPTQLFVVADGPRIDRPNDIKLCMAVRQVVNQVNWDCDVITDYSDVNLGIQRRISSGISKVFEQVEEAIILEDDCIPHPSFFQYCTDLLDKYRDDNRIMAISGNNFQRGNQRTLHSYYFSIYPHCWGWATWRRAWHLYDNEMALWPQKDNQAWLRNLLRPSRAAADWNYMFEATSSGKIDSWAFRWTLSCWLQSGLTILPSVNLISNVGVGEDATHTKRLSGRSLNLQTESISFPLCHPPTVIRNWDADRFTENYHFANDFIRHYLRRLKRSIFSAKNSMRRL